MDAHRNKTLTVDTEARQCEKHGEYEARRLIGTRFTSCPTCADEERTANEALIEAQRKADADARRTQRIQALLGDSGLIGRQLRTTFDGYRVSQPKQQAVLDSCRDYMAQFVKGQPVPKNTLWLIGPAGTGKSHLGAAMVKHLIRIHAAPARIHTIKELIRMLRASWNRAKGETKQHYVENDDGSCQFAIIEPQNEDELIRSLVQHTRNNFK